MNQSKGGLDVRKLKERLRKTLYHKSDGIVDQYLPALVTLIFLLMITLFFIYVISDINVTNQVHQIARKYILRMESEGGLTDSTKAACEAELKNIIAVVDDSVSVTGSSVADTSYGDPVTITIQVRANMANWANQGTFVGQIVNREKTITVTKQSTAKY